MVPPFDMVTTDAQETQKLGENMGRSLLGKKGSTPRLICLWGELGSGKTTFVQGFARGLGITSRLLSPTFIIVRRYRFADADRCLYHLDLYRTVSSKEVQDIGFSEMIREPGSIVIVEWPERLGGLLPEHRVDIRFTVLPDGRHAITSTVGGNKMNGV